MSIVPVRSRATLKERGTKGSRSRLASSKGSGIGGPELSRHRRKGDGKNSENHSHQGEAELTPQHPVVLTANFAIEDDDRCHDVDCEENRGRDAYLLDQSAVGRDGDEIDVEMKESEYLAVGPAANGARAARNSGTFGKDQKEAQEGGGQKSPDAFRSNSSKPMTKTHGKVGKSKRRIAKRMQIA